MYAHVNAQLLPKPWPIRATRYIGRLLETSRREAGRYATAQAVHDKVSANLHPPSHRKDAARTPVTLRRQRSLFTPLDVCSQASAEWAKWVALLASAALKLQARANAGEEAARLPEGLVIGSGAGGVVVTPETARDGGCGGSSGGGDVKQARLDQFKNLRDAGAKVVSEARHAAAVIEKVARAEERLKELR